MLSSILIIYGLITQCHSTGIRKSTHTLSPAEKDEFLKALYLMKSEPSIYDPTYTAYDFFVHVHLQANDPLTTFGHAQWSFLPWHRIFLYLFEKEIQRVTNNPNLYLPYWNPTNITESDILLFDETFLGGNGAADFPHLLSNNAALGCDKFKILPELNGRKEYDYTCLHRQIGQGVTAENWDNSGIAKQLYQELLPKSKWDAVIAEYRDYDVDPYNSARDEYTISDHASSFRSQLEGCNKWNDDGTINADLEALVKHGACLGLHGSLHWHIGGQLASLASPNDPLFFMLHNWIDLMWSRYQNKYNHHKPLTTIPADKLDTDITQGDYGVINNILSARQVLNHEVQLDYIFDYDYNLDKDQDLSGYYYTLQNNERIGGLLLQTGDVLMVDMALNRPAAYGDYDIDSKTGSLTFDDVDTTKTFTFDSINGIITLDDNGQWIKQDISGTYIGGAIVSRGLGNSITIDMSIVGWQDATGTYSDPVFPNEYGLGSVTHPEFGYPKTFYYYGDERRIYWDKPRCNNSVYWEFEQV